MPKTTLIFAALLILLGLGAFATSSSSTALLPAYVGIPLGALAGLAMAFDGARKHLSCTWPPWWPCSGRSRLRPPC
jgi:hypothetical protein